MRVCVIDSYFVLLTIWVLKPSTMPREVEGTSSNFLSCPPSPWGQNLFIKRKKLSMGRMLSSSISFSTTFDVLYGSCIPFGCKRVTSMEIPCHEISFIVIISITCIFLFNFHLLVYWILVERWIKKLCMLFVEIWDKYFSLRLIL